MSQITKKYKYFNFVYNLVSVIPIILYYKYNTDCYKALKCNNIIIINNNNDNNINNDYNIKFYEKNINVFNVTLILYSLTWLLFFISCKITKKYFTSVSIGHFIFYILTMLYNGFNYEKKYNFNNLCNNTNYCNYNIYYYNTITSILMALLYCVLHVIFIIYIYRYY